MRHAKGAIDAAPAVALEIERDKQIARKDGRTHRAQLAGMTHGLAMTRKKSAKALRRQLPLITELTVRQSVDNIPALRTREIGNISAGCDRLPNVAHVSGPRAPGPLPVRHHPDVRSSRPRGYPS